MPIMVSPCEAALIGAEPDLVYWLTLACIALSSSKASSSPMICTSVASVV